MLGNVYKCPTSKLKIPFRSAHFNNRARGESFSNYGDVCLTGISICCIFDVVLAIYLQWTNIPF